MPLQRFWRRVRQRTIVLFLLTAALFCLGFGVQDGSRAALIAYILLSVLWLALAFHLAAALAGYASIRSRVRERTEDMKRQEEAHGRDHHDNQRP